MPRTPPYAVIQSQSIEGNLEENVRRHVHLVETAVRHGARFALFPELSLTGYELDNARALAITHDDPRLGDLRDQARISEVSIVVGAPLLEDNGDLSIGAIAFLPNGALSIYRKQHLHAGETAYFVAGRCGATLDVCGRCVALAVCADIARPRHPREAAESGAAIYAASVLIGENGYETDTAILKRTARNYGMPVLMANHAGATGGWTSAGRSAVWNADGDLIAAAAGNQECVLLAERENGDWSGRVVMG